VPLAWRELKGLEAANQWNIFTIHERLAKQRTDPWKDYAGTKQTLEAALKQLG
jgi:bifunctional non-homologous end joining protein LigD